MLVQVALEDERGMRWCVEWFWELWKTISFAILPHGASRQAARIASGLGSRAAASACAGQFLDLPLAATNKVIDAAIAAAIAATPITEPIRGGARALLWAHAEALRLWLEQHGGGLTATDTGARLQELIDYYHSHTVSFTTVACRTQNKTVEWDVDSRLHEPQTCAGYRVVDRRDPQNEQLLSVDILPNTLTRELGWSQTEVISVMNDLNARALLKAPQGRLQSQRRIGADRVRVYSIDASVFTT
jgi:hypothetical protein